MKPKYIVGAVIIVAFIIFATLSLRESLTPYVSLAEAQQTDAIVQVKGQRVDGSDYFDMEEKIFKFKMTDDTGQEFDVTYPGVKPSNFEQATEVIAIGRFTSGKFEAEQILVKCPSKYQAEGV
jgi:cytochrome c-type biogenesis protein CcmE